MKVVDNGILKIEWDADLYLANKYIGFIAACKQYGDITVVFQEGNAYTLYDPTNPFSQADVLNTVRGAYKIKKGKEASYTKEYTMDEFSEYVLLGSDGEIYESNIEMVGLSEEDGKDILKRLEDIAQLYEEEIVDM